MPASALPFNAYSFASPEPWFSPVEKAGQLYLTQPIPVPLAQLTVRAIVPLPSVDGSSARFALVSGLDLESVAVTVWLCIMGVAFPSWFAYAVICHVPAERELLKT